MAELQSDLQSAGLFGADSTYIITGTLTSSVLNEGMVTDDGKLGARMVVTRVGATRYDRALSVTDVVVPPAAANDDGLYRKLHAKLLNDGDLHSALAGGIFSIRFLVLVEPML